MSEHASPSRHEPPIYHAGTSGTLRRMTLDSLVALYHRPSGRTHVVASPVPEILEMLAEGPATSAALLARLGERFDLRDADIGLLEERLEELATEGLVDRR